MREGTQPAVGASPVAVRSAPSQRSGLVVATVAALLMTLTAALGTGAAPWPQRLAYWLGLMWTGHFIGTGVTASIRGWGRLADRPWLEGLLVALLISLPMTGLVVAAGALVFATPLPRPSDLLFIAGIVLAITATITALGYALNRAPPAIAGTATAAAAAPPPPTRPRLLDRLRPPLRDARLLAIEAEDHYSRVHTDAGSALLLIRLTDAIAETDGVPGARTHRSWWVAAGAVEQSTRRDGRATLTLAGGLTVPVSRNYYRAARDAGLA